MTAFTLPDDLRALTVYAEYAHAIVTGDKTIETRPRPCSHRGWVGIHAAASFTHIRVSEPKNIGRFEVERDQGGLLLRAHASNEWPYRLPLGAIVAVANIVDCVPIVGEDGDLDRESLDDACVEHRPAGASNAGLWLWPAEDAGEDMAEPADITRQLPYGDYTPGRYALLLEDVTRLPRPVPAKGNQAVPWRVPPEVIAEVRYQIGTPSS